ncbi:restriction endonuclease subunit S [Salinicola sp. V024]|uniref:restriction endonuclease subunit S n=1 Tax=Salinicola sp. V024 TaxID=3459609 RepID=UPI0040443B28
MHTSKLSDVARIDRASLSSEKIQAGTLYLGLENIESGGNIVKVQVVENGELKSSKFRFTPEHILYGKLRPYLAKITAPDFYGICSTDIIPILPGSKVDRRYLLHLLRQDSMVKFATSRSSGANLPRLSPKELANFQIPLPLLAEQKRIAAILDAADELRAKRREAIVQLDALLHSTFIDMFGDPVTNPMGWKVASLGEAFNLKHGFAFKSENFVPEGDYILLTPGNFFEQGGFRDRGHKQRYHNAPVPQDYVLDRGDILIAMTEQAPGLLGSPILVPESRKFLHNQRLGKVVKKTDIHSHFIIELMNTVSVRNRIQKDSTGTKVKHTSPAKISSIEIGVPPLDLQHRFATIVESVEQQKTKMRAHLAELDALFASLQHRAFNGEL